MANIGKWQSPTLTTVMSTELNSLANGSAATSASAVDNTTALAMYADIEFNLASLSPTGNPSVSLYIAESVDGTNFPSQSTADFQLTSTQLLCVVPIGTTAATAERVVVRQVLIPPAKFNIILLNSTGVSLNASGNTVKFLTYSINLNG